MTPEKSLLDPDFVRELEALRRRLEVRARSGGAGEHAARRRGGSAEFQDHRAYEPGDDLRRVDWLAFARTGTPVVKLFRAEEDVVVRLLVDSSSSMEFGNPSKLDVARRLAAAFGYMALAGSQRAQVLVARKENAESTRALDRIGPPRRGRGGLAALLREIGEAQARGTGDLARAIDSLLLRASRPGLLVVLSDFFDAGPVTGALSRARAAGHDLSLVHVVTREELEPVLEGDLTLEDSETGATLDVTLDPGAIEAYVLRFAGLVEELRGFARKHSASYLRTLTDEALEGIVRRFVARAID
jgi:uncharacterized protein (DUF58 family)